MQEYVGGYEDWLRQRRQAAPDARKTVASSRDDAAKVAGDPAGGARKPSYKEQLELERLPAQIEALESEQRQLQSEVTSADFYKRSAAEIHRALARLEELETLLLSYVPPNGADHWSRGNRRLYEEIAGVIEQLDEPEQAFEVP